MAGVSGQVTNPVITALPTGQHDSGSKIKVFQPANQVPFAGVAPGAAAGGSSVADAAVVNLIVSGLIAAGIMKAV